MSPPARPLTVRPKSLTPSRGQGTPAKSSTPNRAISSEGVSGPITPPVRLLVIVLKSPARTLIVSVRPRKSARARRRFSSAAIEASAAPASEARSMLAA